MIARSTIALALRTFLFVALFVGPVGALALQEPLHGTGMQGAGLVLLVSLQRVH